MNELRRGQEQTGLQELQTTTIGSLFEAFERAGGTPGEGSLLSFPTLGDLLGEIDG
jgi:hypothetical protein